MCPKAYDWQSKAVLTSFVCTWFFSILQGGSHCSCVDNWKISVAGSDARKKKNKKKTNGSEQEDQEEAPEEEEGTEVPAGEAEVPDGADPSALAALQELPNSWPPAVGGVRYVKDFSGKRLEYYLQRCLTIIRNGGFHLMAHAREEIKEKNLRGSGEKRESMLTKQVFKYVLDNLFQERTGNPASTSEVRCDYENFYTQEKNADAVEKMFSDPESSNFTWITVNPHKCGEGFGFTVANILHHLEKQKRSDDHIQQLSTILTRVLEFVARSPGVVHSSCATNPIHAGPLMKISPTVSGIVSRRCVGAKIGGTKKKAVTTSSIAEVQVSQTLEHQTLNLPSNDDCVVFRKRFNDSDATCPILVLLNRVYVAFGKVARLNAVEQWRSARLFVVFDPKNTSAGQEPSIVFPVDSSFKHDRVQYKLKSSAVFWHSVKPAQECWTHLNTEEVKCNMQLNTEDGTFCFEQNIVKSAVAGMLESVAMGRKWEESEFFHRMLGNGVSNSDIVPWMIDTGSAAGTHPPGFKHDLLQARMLVDDVIAVDPEGLKEKKVCDEEWMIDAIFQRTGFRHGQKFTYAKTFEQMIKKLKLGLTAQNTPESALAFYVDLLNVFDLQRLIAQNREDLSETGWVCICTFTIDVGSRQISSVQMHAPSWVTDFKCTAKTRFIFLVRHNYGQQWKRSLLALVSKIESTAGERIEEDLPCCSVIEGMQVQKSLRRLWDECSNCCSCTRFCRRLPPRAVLGAEQRHASILNWCKMRGMVSPLVPGDGNCFITAILVGAAVLPCMPQKRPSKVEQEKWAARYAAVVNLMRQLLYSLFRSIFDRFVEEYGGQGEEDDRAKRALDVLFGDHPLKDHPLKVRFKGLIDRTIDNVLKPGNWGSDLEIAGIACLLGVNVNVLSRTPQPVVFLSDLTVRAFHHDVGSTARVQVTGPFPTTSDLCRDTLPPFDNFVTVDAKQRSDDVRPPCIWKILGLFENQDDLLDVTVEVAIGRGYCDALSSHGARTSVFIVHNGTNHYDPLLSCPDRPLPVSHKSKGADVITDRLNGTAPSAVATHLLQLALRAFLQGDVSPETDLFAVCCCRNNEKLDEVCERMKIWNTGIIPESVRAANVQELAVIGQEHTTRSNSSTRQKYSPNGGKRQQVHHKLRKNFRVMVPASREDVGKQLDLLGRAQQQQNLACSGPSKISEWQSQLVSIMTIVCHDFAKQAKKNGRDPLTHHFENCTRMPSTAMLVDMTADAESSNVGSPMVVDTTIEIPSIVRAMFEVYTSLQRLVSFLCQGTEEAHDYVAGCAMLLVSVKGLFGPGTLPSDLWRAAFYAHCSPRFTITHGYLNVPIRATIVPASTEEFYGTVENTVKMRDRKIKENGVKLQDVRLPMMLHYISVLGGWGIFTLEKITEGKWLTEYGGRVVDQIEANRMIKAGEATHLRTISGMKFHLDGRVQGQWDMEYYITRHMVRFWNRFSFSFLDSRWLYGIMTMGYMFCNRSAVFSTTFAEVFPPLRKPSTLVWTPHTLMGRVTITRLQGVWNVST
jgi:hypothetical protein